MSSAENGSHKGHLGWFLCWAVVFADIGTSVYYVPGILYGQVQNLAGLFVLLSSVVFVLLTLKYIEISDRYPEGGGVVTVASHAFNPWWGALGGMFITVDYYLTAAISSVSGFSYLASILPLGHYILWGAVIGIIFLAILNVIGIKESAGVTAVVAIAAFIVDIIVVGFVISQMGPGAWHVVFSSLGQVTKLTPWALLTGFAGAFLAFSGLESISQLSPAMQTPRLKTASIAMFLVVISIMLTAPFLTLFSTNLLNSRPAGMNETSLELVGNVAERTKILARTTDPQTRQVLQHQIDVGNELSGEFISELGAQYGGKLLKIAVVLTASVLLLFASNTAIIGAYHVFIALSRQYFLPNVVQTYNTRFGTPHWSILAAALPPIIIVIATQGNLNLLGELYAFGLLGAFALSSIGLDVVRFKEKKVDFMFYVGVFTSVLVVVAWVTNLYSKQLATMFGGGITIIGMIIAYTVHTRAKGSTVAVEAIEEVPLATISSIAQHQVLVPVYSDFDPILLEFVAKFAHNNNYSVVLLYLREFTDILQTVHQTIQEDDEGAKYLIRAKKLLEKDKVPAKLLYDSVNDMGDAINGYRKKLKPSLTVLSPQKKSLIEEFLKGNVVKKVVGFKNGNVLIHTGINN